MKDHQRRIQDFPEGGCQPQTSLHQSIRSREGAGPPESAYVTRVVIRGTLSEREKESNTRQGLSCHNGDLEVGRCCTQRGIWWAARSPKQWYQWPQHSLKKKRTGLETRVRNHELCRTDAYFSVCFWQLIINFQKEYCRVKVRTIFHNSCESPSLSNQEHKLNFCQSQFWSL